MFGLVYMTINIRMYYNTNLSIRCFYSLYATPVGFLKYAYFAALLRMLGCDVIAGKLIKSAGSPGQAVFNIIF